MDKKSFNLRIEPKLLAEVKIQAVRDGRTITAIMDQLLREYLERAKAKK